MIQSRAAKTRIGMSKLGALTKELYFLHLHWGIQFHSILFLVRLHLLFMYVFICAFIYACIYLFWLLMRPTV